MCILVAYYKSGGDCVSTELKHNFLEKHVHPCRTNYVICLRIFKTSERIRYSTSGALFKKITVYNLLQHFVVFYRIGVLKVNFYKEIYTLTYINVCTIEYTSCFKVYNVGNGILPRF